ncbi:MAG: fibronectin type III domain-containing protein [Saprospiraceae bacterium]|nr:fibronectin type III domain-containing protein [Candidatus Opimibacter iunctus]
MMLATGSAQVNYYTFTQNASTYAEITGGTVLGSASNNFNLAFVDPEVPEGAQNPIGPGFEIGFPFTYRGIVYDRFGVSNNGWICLGRSQYQDEFGYAVRMHAITTTPLNFPASFDTLRSCIAAFAGYITGNGSSTDLRFELLGSAPERTLVIQWKNYKVGPIFQSGASSINAQIRINEVDNSIDIRYGACSFVNVEGLYTIQVGLGGLTVNEFSNRTTPSNWNATSAGTTPSSNCPAYVVYPPPSSGTNFHWDPPSCVPPSNLTVSGLGYDSLGFSWDEPYTNPMEGYEYALTTTIAPPMAGTTTFLSGVSFQNLSEGTLYFFHIRTLCDMEDQSAWLTIPARTLCAPSVPPYVESFDNVIAPEMPGCIRTENESPYSVNWETITSPYTVISPPNAATLDDPYAFTRDWLFLPALELSSDTTYINKMDMNSYQGDSLVICLGTSLLLTI